MNQNPSNDETAEVELQHLESVEQFAEGFTNQVRSGEGPSSRDLADQFPGYYNSLFITLWSSFVGAQKVVRMTPGGGSAVNFATGLAAPIDVAVSADGSLYVADWATGIIFRISYTG